MIRALIAAALRSASAPVVAETFGITGGTVALGDGSEPIPDPNREKTPNSSTDPGP